MRARPVRVGVFDQIVSGGGVRLFTTKLLQQWTEMAGRSWRFHLMWPLFDSSDNYLPRLTYPNVSFERINLDSQPGLRRRVFPALREIASKRNPVSRALMKRLDDAEESVREDEQRRLRALDGRGLRWLDERSDEFDLIYLPYPYLTLPAEGGWRPRKPLVITLHDLAHEQTDAWGDLTLPLRREVREWARISDLVIFSSDYIKDEAQKIYELSEERAERIYLCPSRDAHAAAGPNISRRYGVNKPYVFTLGWAAKHKRVETVVEGFALFRKETGADVALVFAGPKTESLRSGDTHGLELGRDLFALGYVPEEDIPALYRDSSAVVTASISEAGFNAMVFDAMNCERPVICSNIPQFMERLGADDSLALTFDPFSARSLADALRRHFADPQAAALRARRAKQFIASRTLADVGRDYLAAFESVLAARA